MSSFCIAKATHILSAKNTRILYIESAKTVNEMTLNELVMLTTLWTTGPSCFVNEHRSLDKDLNQTMRIRWLNWASIVLIIIVQPIYAWRPIKGTLANSVHQDQTPQNASSDHDLHCLHQIQDFHLNMVIIQTNQTPLLLERAAVEVSA